ncbi:DUF4387 domain-containing protein [Paracoccus sp. (in: a-proteobacteria)]|uniref:DUF4387 domain-containing protein n=1 Tax=Paracoccus sp. TaxID=267 RepID=UPI002B000D08|nr:DUF4387 domain-containing protein [Paracoccus sp. (in: a-proteobacteria)]
MSSLQTLAKVIRSKNAGPCLVTFDLIFDDEAIFRRCCAALAHLRAEVARRYQKPMQQVLVVDFAPALAIKITIPRDAVSGDPGDNDVYGAQQAALLLDIDIPEVSA